VPEKAEPIRVAIACQGGGSHTAFTAGVLSRLLKPDVTANYKIVGLSGTSGGAICALLSWAALVDGQPEKAADLLHGFWADNSASSLPERMLNQWMLWAGRLADYVATPQISPYDNPASVFALNHLRNMVQNWVDFDRINYPDTDSPGLKWRPLLVLGAVDVVSGVFKAFDSRLGEITADAVLASAAIPNLFRSVSVGDGLYWDGLFSQNPPVRDLLAVEPDELWVIQINPQARSAEPRTLVEIADRRNELSGNLSLYQELHFIEKIDQLLEEGVLVGDRYRPVAVRIIEKSRSEKSRRLGTISKLNRDPAFLEGLIADGAATAEDFVSALAFESAWRSKDTEAVCAFFADDCTVTSQDPFPAASLHNDKDGLRRFIFDRLATDIEVDMTRRQFAGDEVLWRIRFTGQRTDDRQRAQASARFQNGKIIRFALGPSAGNSRGVL
jgi:NTE family protein